jgi:hypothetical protein
MTVKELITRLKKIEDEDQVVIFTGWDGGWTNINIDETPERSTVSMVPLENRDN